MYDYTSATLEKPDIIQETGGNNKYTKVKGTTNNYKNGDDNSKSETPSPSGILPQKDYRFIINVKIKQTYSAGDPGLNAAKHYLRYQFNYGDKEADSLLEKYRNQSQAQKYWGTPFKEVTPTKGMNLNESASGYLYRLKKERYDEPNRDFMIQILREYGLDKENRYNNPSDLNHFILTVSNFFENINLIDIQSGFEEQQIIDQKHNVLMGKTLDTIIRSESNKTTNNEKKTVPEKTQVSASDIKNNTGAHFTEADKIGSLKQQKESWENPQRNHYTQIATSLVDRLMNEDSESLGTKPKINLSDLDKNRLKKYLTNIVARQVRYNFLSDVKRASSYDQLNSYVDAATNQLSQTEDANLVKEMITYYTNLKSEYGKNVPIIQEKIGTGDIGNRGANNDNIKAKQKLMQAKAIDQAWIEYNKNKLNADMEWIKESAKYPTLSKFRSDYRLLDVDKRVFFKVLTAEEIDKNFVQQIVSDQSTHHRSGPQSTPYSSLNPNSGSNIGAEETKMKNYFKQKRQLEAIRENAKIINKKSVVPLKAILLPEALQKGAQQSVPIPLELYLEKQAEDVYIIHDFTNPLYVKPYKWSGEKGSKGIKGAINKFVKDSHDYPAGELIIERTKLNFNQNVTSDIFGQDEFLRYSFKGKEEFDAWLEELANVTYWMNKIGLVVRIIPLPATKIIGQAMVIAAQVIDGASAVASINNRIQDGTFQWDLQTTEEISTVVSSILPGAKKLAKGKMVKQVFKITENGNDYLGYVLIPLSVKKQMDEIDRNKEKNASERAKEKQQLIEQTIIEFGADMVLQKAGNFTDPITAKNQQVAKTKKNTNLVKQVAPGMTFITGKGLKANNYSESQFSFVGKEAFKKDATILKGLNLAIGMQQKGYEKNKIRFITSWFLGPDNKWRYEIDDSQMKFAKKNQIKELSLRLNDDSNLIEELEIPMKELVNFPKLYKLFPDLEDRIVSVYQDKDSKTAASYTRTLKTFSLNLGIKEQEWGPILTQSNENRKLTEELLLKKLKHEIQHYIQEREGFESGTSPENELKKLKTLITKSGYNRENILRELGDKANQFKEYEKLISQRMYLAKLGEIESRDVEDRGDYDRKKRETEEPEVMLNTYEPTTHTKRYLNQWESGLRNMMFGLDPDTELDIKMQLENGKFKGAFTKTGETIINLSHATPDTPIHEVGHFFIDLIEKMNPTILANLKDQIGTNEAFQKEWARIENDPNYSSLSESGKIKEVLAQIIGQEGAKLADQGTIQKAIRQIWEAIASLFKERGLEATAKRMMDGTITLEEFTKSIASELTDGKQKTNMASKDYVNFMEGKPVEGIEFYSSVLEYIYLDFTDQKKK